MAAELKVGIGVDATGLDTGLNKAESQLKGFGKTVGTETKKVGASFQGMSRVLQDAAFGPGAIANNLSALGDDFKQLSQSAKDSGQSIGKTLIQSLTGAGGLNLALGGLTLGLSLASFGLSAWTRLFGDSNKEVKKGTDELKAYVDSLESVTQAQLKGGQSAQTELATLNALFHAYQNANLPLKTRKEAYKQIQEQYPDYFGSLKFEKEATDKTQDAYNRLTNSILATARARAAADLIAKNASQQLINEQKIVDLERERVGLIKDAANAQIALNNAVKTPSLPGGGGAGITSADILAGRATAAVAESIAKTNALKAENNRLSEENLRLEKSINVQLKKGADLAGKSGAAQEEAIKNTVKNLPSIGVGLGVDFGASMAEGLRQTAPRFNVAFNAVTKGLETLDGIKTPELKFLDPNVLLAKANENLDAFKQGISDKFTTDIGPALSQAATDAFSNIGIALGQALASGTNIAEAIGKTLLSSIGSLLVELGKMAIQVGIGLIAIKKAFQSLNPYIAIAAGVALVALGSAFSAGVKDIGNSMGGVGKSSAPTSVSSGFQAQAPTSSFAGTGQMQLIPSTVIKGNDIVISYNRSTALNTRQGV